MISKIKNQKSTKNQKLHIENIHHGIMRNEHRYRRNTKIIDSV